MITDFSERTRAVMRLAEEEAALLEHESIGAEHLVLALLRHLYLISIALDRSRDDYDAFRAGEIRTLIEPGEKYIFNGFLGNVVFGRTYWKLPFLPSAERVLQNASDEAVAVGHNMLEPEHLVLGLIWERNELLRHVLLRAKLDFESARRGALICLGV